jgi:bacterial/archaeal transporter family protein
MSYLPWAIFAMIVYGVATFGLKVVFKSIHPALGLTVVNIFVVFAGVGWVVITGSSAFRNVGLNLVTAQMLGAGVVLAAAIVTFYKGLSLGPASVVVPIFALSMTVAAVLAMVFLDEPVKATRVAGLILAAAAIVLLTR